MPRYMRRRVSHTQVDKAGKCARQLMYYRDGEPEKFKSIVPIQGTATHVGCQHFVQHHDLDRAIDAALMTLWLEINEFGEDNILWEGPIRLTKGWQLNDVCPECGARGTVYKARWKQLPFPDKPYKCSPKPSKETGETGCDAWLEEGLPGTWRDFPRAYKGDEGRMSNLGQAEALTRAMVTAWADRFPLLSVTPLAECPECGAPNEDMSRECGFCETVIAGIERDYILPLTPYGIAPWTDPDTGEKIPWELKAKLDVETDSGLDGSGPGGVADLKVSRKPWTKDDVPEDRPLTWADVDEKHWEKRTQGLIYMECKLHAEGRLPAWFCFINIPRTGVKVSITQADPEDSTSPFTVEQIGYDPAAIQVIPVDYDPAAVQTAMRYRVQPTIDAIVAWEAGYEPLGNTQGWWCAEDSCAYYKDVCPLGAAARGGARTVEPVETNGAAPVPVQGAA